MAHVFHWCIDRSNQAIKPGMPFRQLWGGALLIIAFVLCVSAERPRELWAQTQGHSVRVGDLIEYEYFNQKEQQTVLEITADGRLRVERDFGSSKVSHHLTPSDARLIPKFDKYPEQYRTWSDATGKFSIDATIFDCTESEARLLKRDGLVVVIPVNKLSDADQAQLKAAREKMLSETNPFAGGLPGPDGVIEEVDYQIDNLKLPGVKVFVTNRRELPETAWRYVPERVEKPDYSLSVPLPKSMFGSEREFFTDIGIFVNKSPSNQAAVLRFESSQKFSEAMLIDLSAKELVGHFKLPINRLNDFVISPVGNTVATLNTRFGNADIVFWKSNNGELVPEKAWKLDNANKGRGLDCNSAVFLDERQLLLLGSPITLWNIEGNFCIYSIPCDGKWCLGPDGRHVAFCNESAIWLMRSGDGEILGRIPLGPEFRSSPDSLDFSPDGQRLVATSNGHIVGFDLTNGEPLFSFVVPGGAFNVQWADNSLLFLNESRVFDPRLEVDVWQFSRPNSTVRISQTVSGGYGWVASNGHLNVFALIDNTRRTAINDNTAGLDDENIIAFGAGKSVAVVANFPDAVQEANKVTAILKSRLEQRGMLIDDSSALTVEAIKGINGQPGYGIQIRLADKQLWQAAAAADDPLRYFEIIVLPEEIKGLPANSVGGSVWPVVDPSKE
ncbi:MAG: SHD1 domain-containing protein [Pirellulaceae bacterium]|nr:SHD1 domain-containing protein [Pirellulaceae bacterium]